MPTFLALWIGGCGALLLAWQKPSFYESPDYRLHLGGHHFDPLYERNGQDAAWLVTDPKVTDFQLVQFHGPTRPEDLAFLKRAGLDPVSYLFPFTYVVWGRGTRTTLAKTDSRIRWTGAFVPGYRLLPAYRGESDTEVTFRALLYRGAKKSTVLTALKDAGAEDLHWFPMSKQFAGIRFKSAQKSLATMAKIPGVMSLQPVPTDGGLRGEMSAQHLANQRDMGGAIQPGYAAWLSNLGLSGQGVIMAIVDGGIDSSHSDFSMRELPCTGAACAGGIADNHGTHVAGVALGDGSTNALDGSGFLRGLGVAPETQFVDLLETFHTQPGGMLNLMTQAVRLGAVISNNSWGASSQALGYDMDTMMVDMGVRDADPDAAGDQGLSYVLAINNGSGQIQSQGTPDEAKNVIRVGATVLQQSTGGQDAKLDDLASVTAYGPARDGRMLPDMVAPGCRVDGTVLGNGHLLRCGTSFAAPQVSGAAALFIQHFRELQVTKKGVNDPSPALVKAALMASTVNLEGQLGASGSVLGHRPDSRQGWGRPQLDVLLDATVDKTYYDGVLFQASGDEWEVPLEVVDPALPAQLTLVWTDAPGHGLGGSTPAWNNDLDLEVDYQGQTYLGNHVGMDGWSASGGQADFRNNGEGVWLGPTATGNVQLRVKASQIAWDGIPEVGGLTDQDFALVATNLKERQVFVMTSSNLAPKLCLGGEVEVPLAFAAFGQFAEQVSLTISGLPANVNGQFSPSFLTPPGQSTLTLTTSGGVLPGIYSIQVTGQSAGMMETLDFDLEIFNDPPAVVALQSPMPLTHDHPLETNFSWLATTGAAAYEWQLAADENFSVLVDTQTVAGLSTSVSQALTPFTRYFWRVRALNPCAPGPWSEIRRFRTRLVPPILLVDDDGDAPDVRSFYTNALDQLGQNYDLWDTQNSTQEPGLETLRRYQMIIWFSGATTNFSDPKAGPTLATETSLATFLDEGGCLLLSSQEYLYDRGGPTHHVPNAFMTDYLGVGSGMSDVDQTEITGNGSVFGNIGTQMLTHVFPNQSDRLSPGKLGSLAFSGDLGDAAVSKQTANYQTHFTGFSLTALSEAIRSEVFAAVIGACPPTLPMGCLNLKDLLAQAEQWPIQNIQDLLNCLDQYSGKRKQ